MNDDARTGRGGFTLLEIVIALTALALVTVICYGAFHLGIRAMERGEVAVVAAQRLRVATDVIIRQIKSIVPYKARNRDDEEYVFFMGTASSMAFITAPGLEVNTWGQEIPVMAAHYGEEGGAGFLDEDDAGSDDDSDSPEDGPDDD